MPTYAVRYTYDERDDVRDVFRAEHRAYLSGLASQATLLVSGPFAEGPRARCWCSGPATRRPSTRSSRPTRSRARAG